MLPDYDKKQFWTIIYALIVLMVILYIWHYVYTSVMWGGFNGGGYNNCSTTVPAGAVAGSISCQAYNQLTAAQQNNYVMSVNGGYYVPTGSGG